jgi:ubiquinone/menaquinone biosynthesis C-methylase UbiE
MTALLAVLGAAIVGAVVWARRNPAPFPVAFTPLLESRLRRRVIAPDTLVQRLGITTDMRVLEIGPGGGIVTEALARVVPPGQLVCLDIQPRMLAKVRTRLRSAPPMLVCGSATTLPFRDASFDRIVLVTVLGEVPDRGAALRELARMLRDDGVVAITESLPDPDFITHGRLVREASAVGLTPTTRTGSWFSYTQQLGLRRSP